MFKLAIWISILLVVVSLVLIAPSMNPALAASSVEQDSDSGSEDIVIAANTQLARELSARDEIIATRIDAAYLGERRLKPYYIEVTVKQGVVTLKGAVASEDERRLALLIASEQEYVQEVHNYIEVQPAGLIKTSAVVMDPGGEAHSSAELKDGESPDYSLPDDMAVSAQRPEQGGLGNALEDAGMVTKVKTRLLIHFGFRGLAINVDADNQIVRLSGTVDDPELATHAGQIVATTPGVRLVQNDIKVEVDTSSAQAHPLNSA